MKTFRRFMSVVEAVLGAGENYGSSSFQERQDEEQETKRKKEQEEREKRRNELYLERTRGRGIRARSEDPKDGKVKWGWIKDGQFTPDADN